jgi:hypothetical protein
MRSWIANRLKLHLDAQHFGVLPDCTPKERWVRDTKWAVYKKGNKRASRLLDSEEEAVGWIAEKEDAENYKVVFREGESVRCARYCSAAPWCEQWKRIQEEAGDESSGSNP